jgi:hypothetical protein
LLKKAGLTPQPNKDIKERESLFREFAARQALFQAFAEYQKAHRSVIVAYHDIH